MTQIFRFGGIIKFKLDSDASVPLKQRAGLVPLPILPVLKSILPSLYHESHLVRQS
ncbi:hypothetical protein [Bacillus sp. BP-3]|uniref:hypothetical protein n=1 Tax=Bacillus sp. BP-3 TaxID=3022773 RepID=UPI00232DFF5D|nr:hypothetical protein [Bacillus sp. BP-3]